MTELQRAAVSAEALLAHAMVQIGEEETTGWCRLPVPSVMRVLEDLRRALPSPAPAGEYPHLAKTRRVMREAGPPGPIDENEVHENSRGLDCE